MVLLRNFADNDAEEFQLKQNTNMSLEEIKAMFTQWKEKDYARRYFEMFAVIKDAEIVGTISLYQHSMNIVSCGPEIFECYRKQGLGEQAMLLAMDIAKIKGYKMVFQQIRVTNVASISLHDKLGFETSEQIFKNRHGNEVLIYIKML